jgi:hypothetical protein
MNWIEILLIILGVVAFIASFMIKGKPDKKNEEVVVDPEVIKGMVGKEIGDIKERVNEVVDETLQYAVEKTERASERISNEKIMAINEYSDTVLADINKNHQEVIFLYDMLNEKHNNLKETVKQVDKTTREAKEITKGISESEEKFEAFTTVDQLPHIQPVPTVPAVSTVPTVQPVQPQHPVQTAQIVQMPIVPAPQPETVVEENVELVPAVVEDNSEEEPEEEKSINNNDRILEMHKAGVNNVEIAKELGLGVGEVKLVINLFKGAI